jgi:nucleoside-diphosphate-sugar epimerase
MRVFVTGATGFIGTRLVPELVSAGHSVLGLTRSDAGAEVLRAQKAEPFRGDIYDLESIRRGSKGVDAVIHLAFNHDFSTFKENCEQDRRVIDTMAGELVGKRLIVTSGVAMAAVQGGGMSTEDTPPVPSSVIPRGASEEATDEAAAKGVHASVVRLPQVHDNVKQGLVPFAIQIMKQQGYVAYVGDGSNRWAAAAVDPVARLYRLVLEKGRAGARYNAVGEEGVSMRAMCEVIARGLKLPIRSITAEEAPAYYGWMAHFATMDMPASSAKTQAELGWDPSGVSLVEDLGNMDYSKV